MSAKDLSRTYQDNTASEEKYFAVINHPSLSWDQLTQETLSLLGLSIFDRLDSPELKIPRQCPAYDLGHTKIREFITGSFENCGMSQSWDNWVENVMAFRISKEIGVVANDAETLLRDYNSVVKKIGRKPTNAQEFNRSLTEIKSESVEAAKTRSKARLEALESRVGNLLRDIDYEKAISKEYQEQISNLELQIDDMSSNHEVSIAEQERRLLADAEKRIEALKVESEAEKELIRQESIQKIEKLKAEHKLELIAVRKEYEDQIEKLKTEHELHIKTLKEEFQNRIEALEGEVVDLKEKYETGSYIEISKYEELEKENISFRNRIEKYEAQLSALESDLKSYDEKIKEYEEEKSKNNEMMGELRSEISNYEEKLKSAIVTNETIKSQALTDLAILKENGEAKVDALKKEKADLENRYNEKIEAIKSDYEKRMVDYVNDQNETIYNLHNKISDEISSRQEAAAEYQNKLNKLQMAHKEEVSKIEARISLTSVERVEGLESDVERYRNYLEIAKEKYEQLKFKHRILLKSQFEMSEQLDDLTVKKIKLIRKIKRQNRVISEIEATINKYKKQALIAVILAAIVSSANWLF